MRNLLKFLSIFVVSYAFRLNKLANYAKSSQLSHISPMHLPSMIFHPLPHRPHILRLAMSSQSIVEDEDELIQGMPDKVKFREFFDKVTASSSPPPPAKRGKSGKAVKAKNVKKAEMKLDEILTYDVIRNLLNDELISMNDINDLWVSSTGEASGLDFDEAYEFLCMVCDLPDPGMFRLACEVYGSHSIP
jgi:hypothetical protein